MKTSEFHFDLPEHLIAQKPTKNRDDSRLLVLNRKTNSMEHAIFKNITKYLSDKDILVFNNTKVINARINTKRKTNGKVECFLLEPLSPNLWLALLKPSKRLQVGETLQINDRFTITIIEKNPQTGMHKVKIQTSGNIYEELNLVGSMPLPPYIKAPLQESSDYQTLLASQYGSVAAPTAGRHFSKELLAELSQKNIQTEMVTLHIGYGTFKPIQSELIENHSMHEERYYLSPETAERLTKAYYTHNIIAVGTTVIRTLESAFDGEKFRSGHGQTNLFIRPGYKFKSIKGIVTNFHLPKSSLFILVSAFYSKQHILAAYSEAIKKEYRFFSFGDAMLIR